MTQHDHPVGTLNFLGKGKSIQEIASSVTQVVVLTFYPFVVATSLQGRIYSLHHRVTYENSFTTHITSQNIDLLVLLLSTVIWSYLAIKDGYKKFTIIAFFLVFVVLLLSNYVSETYLVAISTLPFMGFLIILDIIRGKTILRWNIKLSLTYLSLTASALATFGILGILLSVTTGISTASMEKYPYSIYQELPAILTPILMALIIFCIPLKVILTFLISKLRIKVSLIDICEERLSSKNLTILLSLGITMGIIVTIVPHFPVINPTNERLGVDSIRYADWLHQIENQTLNPVYYIFTTSADRPFTLIVLYVITEVTGVDPYQAVEFSPLLFAPLLVMVTFFLAREITTNDKISLLAAFLTAISFQTLTGIYSGFYANWLALILGYSALGLTIRYLRGPSIPTVISLSIFMTGVLLSHVYTWTILIIIVFIFLIVLHKLKYYPRNRILVLYLVLSSSIAVDLLKSTWTGSSTSFESDVSFGRQGTGFSQFNERLKTLADTVQTYFGGVYANIVILGLVLYWLVHSKPKQEANIFILIFLSTGLFPLFVGDWVLQSRVLYEIPFQIPAAVALYFIWKKNHKVVFTALLLIAFYLSLHVIVNLGFVPAVSQPPLSTIIGG